MKNIKILIAGEPASVHTGKLSNMVKSIGYDVRIFQSTYHNHLDEHLKDVIIYTHFPWNRPDNNNILACYVFNILITSNSIITKLINMSIFRKTIEIVRPHLNQLILQEPREKDLIRVIKKWKPDLIISLKMQNDGYTVSNVKKSLGKYFHPKWVHFNWGTDIEYFGKRKSLKSYHLPKIKNLLNQCDYLIADCYRDLNQASKFGFKGIKLGVMVGNGGYKIDNLLKIRRKFSHNKDTILIKGRHDNKISKSKNIIKAISQIKDKLTTYKIKIILGETINDDETKQMLTGLDYEFIKYVPYEEVLKLFAQSKISISATTVDGTPNFIAESFCMGAFPIHSNIDSVREWIEDGKNGLLFKIDDIDLLKKHIIRAIKDDQLTRRANKINLKIAKERLNLSKNKVIFRNYIERITK